MNLVGCIWVLVWHDKRLVRCCHRWLRVVHQRLTRLLCLAINILLRSVVSILNLRLYRCRTDNDVRSRSVPLEGSRGAFIAIGKDQLQEYQECHDETADINGEPEDIVSVILAGNPVDCVVSRKQPGSAKEERAGIADCVRFDDIPFCRLCLECPAVGNA